MDKDHLIDWFEGRIGLNFEKRVSPLKEVLAVLGHPEKDFSSIHLVGTNGKGSTLAFLSQIFQDQGLDVGTFISPHLVDMRERVQWNGQLISWERLGQLIQTIDKVEQDLGLGLLSYFELWTCAALLYFSQKKVDVALLEVGIGGRLDATNVVQSDWALVTSIGLDHQDLLGDSLEAIAKEKAGIINSRQEVVLGPLPDEIVAVFQEEAQAYGNSVARFGSDFVWDQQGFRGAGQVLEPVKLGLLGDFQQENAALAVYTALRFAQKNQLEWDRKGLLTSLASVNWPGRLEEIEPGVFLDGAHNLPAMERLVSFIKAQGWERVMILLGFLPRKNYQEMVAYLKKELPAADFYLVPFEGGLTSGLDLGLECLETDLRAYLETEKRRPLILTGSLHFIGFVRQTYLLK